MDAILERCLQLAEPANPATYRAYLERLGKRGRWRLESLMRDLEASAGREPGPLDEKLRGKGRGAQ